MFNPNPKGIPAISLHIKAGNSSGLKPYRLSGITLVELFLIFISSINLRLFELYISILEYLNWGFASRLINTK